VKQGLVKEGDKEAFVTSLLTILNSKNNKEAKEGLILDLLRSQSLKGRIKDKWKETGAILANTMAKSNNTLV
jgi:hypothetical protein